MAKRSEVEQIPPRAVVRAFGVVLFAASMLILTVTVLNLQVYGWFSAVLVSGALTTLFFSAKAIQTGNPVWILLDLIWPN